MVYLLPLYDPLRHDRGNLHAGSAQPRPARNGFRPRIGRCIELAYYGENPQLAQEVYAEALELVLKGLTAPALTFHGKFFNVDNVPMELVPLQKPYPPVWYGLHAPESAPSAPRKKACA